MSASGTPLRVWPVSIAALTLCFAAATADPGSRLELPPDDLRAGIAKTMHCVWEMHACTPRYTGGRIWLRTDQRARVETVEFNALLRAEPRDQTAERRSKREVLAMLDYLLPAWKGRQEWLERTLASLTVRECQKSVQVGGVTILAQWIAPSFPGTYVTFYVTKRETLDEFLREC